MASRSTSPFSSPAQDPGHERRRWVRAVADWPISIQLDSGVCEARVRDVSRAGVCFFLDRPIQAMTLLGLRMNLPVPDGVRQVTGTGAVVRCERISARLDHYEIAVFVHDMAEPDREVVAGYVDAWRECGGDAAPEAEAEADE